MGNLIVILVIIAVLTLAISKVVSDKKKGVKCSGCPHAPKNIGPGRPGAGKRGPEAGHGCSCPE